MGRKGYLSIIGVLLLVVAALLYTLIVVGKTERGTEADPRTVVVLEPSERAQVLTEMRQFLIALQGMTEAIASNDAKGFALAARSMGKGAAKDVSPALMGKLPLEFKEFGMSVHGDFDRMAQDAETEWSPTKSARDISETLGKCAACHEMYQIPNKTL